MLNKLQIIWVFLLIVFFDTYSQDINFTQFHTNFLEVNPSFAGSAMQPRLSVNYRNQWPGLNAAFVTYSASYDQPLKPKWGAAGIKISNDVQGSGTLNFLAVDAMYSYQVKLGYQTYLVGALQAGFNQNNLNTDQLEFGNQIDPITGFNASMASEESFSNAKILYPDFATGVSAYYKEHYFGFSVHHLARPSVSFLGSKAARLNRKYSLNYGYTFPVHLNGWIRPHYFITPSILFQKQGSYDQIVFGTYVNSRPLTYGLWIRQSLDILPNSVIFLIGYNKNNLKFSYTYDLSLLRVTGSFGTHEIAFIYLISIVRQEHKSYKEKLKSPWF